MYLGAASNIAKHVDLAFYYIIGICVLLGVILTITMIYFVIRFNRKRHPEPKQIKEKVWLELLWTIGPLIIVLTMFYVGYITYNPMLNPPKDAIKIDVYGRQWSWSYKYSNGKVSDKLYLPLNKPVVLNLYSQDVIHGFFIPAFRVKQDMIPGKNDNFVWFIAQKKDTFDIECTTYCGLQHARMLGLAIVVDEPEYNKWVSEIVEAGALPGLELLKNNGCIACHSLDGTKIIGPSFKNLFGSSEIVIVNGKEQSMKVDEAYIRKHILEAESINVKGYPPGLMKSYKGLINDEQIDQISDYLKSIGKQ